MNRAVAIGVGCRAGLPAEAIEALVRVALDRIAPDRPVGLFTVIDKQGEPGLVLAATRLGLTLAFVSRDALREQAGKVQTVSLAAQSRFDVPSVAEAAALAGAGPRAVLVLPRLSQDGVTCAVAMSEEPSS